MNITVNAYQDTRKKNKQDIYPVSLVIYDGKKQRRCPVLYNDIVLRLSPADYQASQSKRPKDKDRVNADIISENIKRAYDIIYSLSPFSFEKFLAEFTGKGKNKNDIITAYHDLIQDAEKHKTLSIKTVTGYRSALASLLQFFEYKDGKKPDEIPYNDITQKVLNQYRDYILSVEIVKDGKRIKRKGTDTTVSMYLRTLQTVFNMAIDNRDIKPELMPFGKGRGKFKIPSPKQAKRALNKAQVLALFNYRNECAPLVKKALDFWYMSFFGQGMNFNDILKLKYQDVTDIAFAFMRSKTNKQDGSNKKQITVIIDDFIRYMFATYGNPDKSPDNYVFPVLNDSMTDKDKIRVIENFIRSTNQQLKHAAKALNLPAGFSTYYARYSYVNVLLDSGVKMTFVSKSVGHGSTRTTEIYVSDMVDKDEKQVVSTMLYNMVSGAGG